jgi:F0F1-type ATP synthase membrane subunit b/b'
MGRGKTKPAESPQSLGDAGESNGYEVALPQPTSRKQRRRLARRRRRQLKTLERQLLGRRSWLRPRRFRKAVRLPPGQFEGVVDAALARTLEREREGLVEQIKKTLDERLKEMSESLERGQRTAEKRISVRTERSLEQMAESASKRLNRETARLRSELRSGTPSKVSRGGEQPVELIEGTINEHLEAMSKNWQREAEMRIIDRTERSLEQMAQSASKRLNREAARLRSELRNGTPSKTSRERDQQS